MFGFDSWSWIDLLLAFKGFSFEFVGACLDQNFQDLQNFQDGNYLIDGHRYTRADLWSAEWFIGWVWSAFIRSSWQLFDRLTFSIGWVWSAFIRSSRQLFNRLTWFIEWICSAFMRSSRQIFAQTRSFASPMTGLALLFGPLERADQKYSTSITYSINSLRVAVLELLVNRRR